MTAIVRLHALSKTFREGGRQRDVLRSLSAEIAPREVVALLGPSGSGKSTLLNLIAGLDVPSAGRIEVLGTDLGALSETARTLFRRRNVGLVFQSFHLLPTLSVEENVRLPLELDGRDGRAAQDRARELCARVGLGDRLGSFPDVLSGGEQQRVALARAVVMRPRLVLADEPTGSLDRPNADLVLDLLEELRAREQCTVVIATHSAAAAARCDRVLRLDAGELCGLAAPRSG